MASLRIEPVTPANASDLDTLFARGDPKSCQCAFMRLANADWSSSAPATRRGIHHEAIAAATAAGRAAGLIAYDDRDAVGWVSFDVREAYARLDSTTLLRRIDDRPAWSVVCFVVATAARRRGVAGQLLDAAVDYARDHGARLLEAYPVDTAASTTKRSSADLWRGTVSMFEQAGFATVEVRRQHASAPPRPIMRRRVRERRSR